ncbi:related to SUV3 - ATP-dependent RNA helicase, mitochondrial [Pseudozyma flocculosa]|uniref:ATP-dependent RNA helicase SUV3, mitochondrial n=2 Tax=Pseudozyma flocculosa TaxID=84751 RepID=A0A5C3F0H3_9BASI|nr:related to SUV3 - ATP-dependent RNA helicase, mitochondrial [Pseudozyma flocculosa]
MTFAPKKPGQVLGDPTAPDPKFAARKQKKLEKKKRQADPNYRKPFVFTGFPVPTRPERIEMGDKLAAQIDALRERPDIVPRLRNYGISARTAWLVLERLEALPGTFTTHRKKTLTDNEIIAHLYWTWAQKAKGYIRAKVRQKTLTPGVPYGRRFKPGAIAEPPNGEYFTADIDAIRDSYAIEEDACLPRTCMSAFIDWVEVHVRDISASDSAAAVDREVLRATLSQLSLLRKSTDLRLPTYNYPLARTLTRQIHLHIGPTNSGKTHGALVALSKARTGVFAGPLRLLAHEVWERFNQGTISPGVPPRACNLVTGEEQRTVDPLAGLYSCTVEMVNLQRAWDVAVIDEIQMIGDRQRGYAWTDAVIGLPAKEIHLCGEASTVPLIRRIAEACGDEVYVHEYQRLTPLSIADESLDGDLTKVQKGDCVVAFSRSGIFNLKREIEQKTKLRCAVAYGALPPETKSEQAKLFNEGKLDVMVASDAIGMGLNLKIKRVIFDTLTKWNGKETVAMSTSQIKQIAGRAGRYGTKRESDEPDGGIVTTRNANELEMLREALAAPVVPIEQAAIQPSSDAMADLSALLPASATPTPAERVVDVTEDASEASSSAAAGEPAQTEFRPLDKIYGDVSLLARVDPKSFFLSDFSQQRSISPLVEAASSNLLTLQEREKFGNAPANTRDERLMAFLASCVRLFSRGNLVKFDACSADLGTLEVEKLTLDAMGEARRHRGDKLKGAKSAEERRMIEAEPLASHLASDHPLLNSNTLMLLESLHRSLSLYLWLSYRFPLAFCYRQEVEERKTKMEDGIEFCLEGIRFGRARRLRALGRDADADEALQKKSWKETKRDERRSLEDAEQGLRGGQASRWERDEYGSEGGERNGPRRSKYEDQVRREDGQSQRSERPPRPERW